MIVALQILCHYSPRLKRIIIISVLVYYTHKAISTLLNLNICWRKPFKSNLIGILKYKFSHAILLIMLNYSNSKVVKQSDCLKQKNHWVGIYWYITLIIIIIIIITCHSSRCSLSTGHLGPASLKIMKKFKPNEWDKNHTRNRFWNFPLS